MKSFISKYNVTIIVLVVGILLIIAGFICPPLGIIDNSVLIAVGEIFSFTAAVCGLDTYRSTRGVDEMLNIITKRGKEGEQTKIK